MICASSDADVTTQLGADRERRIRSQSLGLSRQASVDDRSERDRCAPSGEFSVIALFVGATDADGGKVDSATRETTSGKFVSYDGQILPW